MAWVTTNIRIEREKLRKLKQRALDANKSVACLLREIIDAFLEPGQGRHVGETVVAQREAIMSWSGTSLGPGFAGEDHDAVLYGGDA